MAVISARMAIARYQVLPRRCQWPELRKPARLLTLGQPWLADIIGQ
jgi:hypothetical protein